MTLTSEELRNCAQFLTHEDRENQEIGLAIATAFNFSNEEIILCMLDYWKGWEKVDTSSETVQKTTYKKMCLGKEIRFTWEPSRFSVHFSFGNYMGMEGRLWLRNMLPHQVDRFKDVAFKFIKQAKLDFL